MAHLLCRHPGPGLLSLYQADVPPGSAVAPTPSILRGPYDVHQVAPHQPSGMATLTS